MNCEGVACGDGKGNCANTAGPVDVASQIVGREAGDRGAVVEVFPQVLVHAHLLLPMLSCWKMQWPETSVAASERAATRLQAPFIVMVSWCLSGQVLS